MARPHTTRHAAGLLVLALLAVGCTPPQSETAPSRGGAALDGLAGSGLVFDPPELDLGRVVPGGFADGLARVRNSGDRPLEIVNFNAPCECTSAKPELPRTLAPNESFSFPVRLDLGRLLRGGLSEEGGEQAETVRRTLTLWTSSGRAAELPVVVELSEELEAEPAVTHFRNVVRGQTATTTVLLSPGRDRPDQAVGVLSVEPDGGPVPVRVEERRSGLAVELDLSVGPFHESGPFETELRVLTDAEPEAIRLLLRADVQEPLLVTPDSIQAPAADPTRPLVVKVHVRRRDGGPIALLDSRSSSGRIKITPLGESPNGAQVLRLLIAVRPWPEEVRGEVLLETDFPGEAGRLTVPVFVKARPPR